MKNKQSLNKIKRYFKMRDEQRVDDDEIATHVGYAAIGLLLLTLLVFAAVKG